MSGQTRDSDLSPRLNSMLKLASSIHHQEGTGQVDMKLKDGMKKGMAIYRYSNEVQIEFGSNYITWRGTV